MGLTTGGNIYSERRRFFVAVEVVDNLTYGRVSVLAHDFEIVENGTVGFY